MSNETDEKQRRAERIVDVVMGVMGADAMARFLREAWDTAAPAMRQLVADALVKRVAEELANPYQLRGEAERSIAATARDLAPKIVAERRADLAAALEKHVAAHFESAVRQAGNEALKEALAVLQKQMAEGRR